MTRSHRQFGPCCNALAMGVVLSASFLNANAQVLSPPVSVTPININPLKPQITGPAGVQGVTQSQNTTATLRWFQPVLSATQPNARDASYFVVCLLDVASNCTYGPAGTGIWIGAATNSIFSRTAVTTGSPFTTGPNIIRGYNYSLTVTLNNSFYNRRLAVSVGACATPATSACTFATPLPVAWSSVDLVAENTGSIPNSMTEQHFYAEARNQGTGDSGNMRSILQPWQVELTQIAPGYPWRCQTDPNAAGLNLGDNDALIAANGDKIYVSTRRTASGTIDTTGLNIIGIHRQGSVENGVGGALLSIPAGMTLDVASLDVAVTRPMGFAVILVVDNPTIIPEVNKANNARADCDVVQ